MSNMFDWVMDSLQNGQSLKLSIAASSKTNEEKRTRATHKFSPDNPDYYSLNHFKLLCDDLLCLNPARDTPSLIETIRIITELLIWSDHNKARLAKDSSQKELFEETGTPDFFDYFLEHNLHVYMCWVLGLGTVSNSNPAATRWGSTFRSCQTYTLTGPPSPFYPSSESSSLSSSPRGLNTTEPCTSPIAETHNSHPVNFELIQLKIQVLQSLNILFESLKTPQVFYYLLSNNFINRLVTRPRLDVQAHDELVPYYVALLKALSAKLAAHPEELAPFFYNAQYNNLPLYIEAIRFQNHPDAMVRVAIRTLTLNVYSVAHPGITRVVISPSNSHYLLGVIEDLSNMPVLLEKTLGPPPSETATRPSINSAEFRSKLSEFLEHLDYIGDILRLGGAALRWFLRPKLLAQVVEPLLYNHHPSSAHRLPRTTLHLLLVNHLLRTLNDPPLVNLALHRLFDLDSNLLRGPPLKRILPNPSPLVLVDPTPEDKSDTTENGEDATEKEEEQAFFAQQLESSSSQPVPRDDIFSGHKTLCGVLDAQLRKFSSRRKLLPQPNLKQPSNETSVTHDAVESIILLLVTLGQTLSKKNEIRPEWLLSLGLCPVRKLRAWFIMDKLTAKPLPQDLLEKERATIVEWLKGDNQETPLSPIEPQHSVPFAFKPKLCHKLPSKVWYHHKSPYTLLRLLSRHSKLHYITLRLAAGLLQDLTYFPGTEGCLEESLTLRLEGLLHDTSGRLKQYLAHPKCPLPLILFEIEKFQLNIDLVSQKLLGLDALVLFSTNLDPGLELASPLAQVSRTVQLYLLLQRLSHWLLRTTSAVPTWWKEIQAYFYQCESIVSETTVVLETFQVIHVTLDESSISSLRVPRSSDFVLLFKDNQSQFLLATVERKTFSKNRKAKICCSFPIIESEINEIPGQLYQLNIKRFQPSFPDKGLAKFSGVHSFPNYSEVWSGTLGFHDYVDSCQAAQNLKAARSRCLSSGRHKLASILELPLVESPRLSQDPLRTH